MTTLFDPKPFMESPEIRVKVNREELKLARESLQRLKELRARKREMTKPQIKADLDVLFDFLEGVTL